MKIKKIMMLCVVTLLSTSSIIGCSSDKNGAHKNESIENNDVSVQKFPEFTGKDFNGKQVDTSIFKENVVTVLSFWYNGCIACVNEMPALEKLNQELNPLNSEIIGVNTEVSDDINKLSEAKDILSKQNCSYRNIYISSGREAKDFLSNITVFPTTILVDQKGQIIDTPIAGNIESEEAQAQVLETIKRIVNGQDVTQKDDISPEDAKIEEDTLNDSATQENTNPELQALYEETEKIFDTHNDLWQKIFAYANKEDGLNPDLSYAEYLTKTLENTKDLTSEEREQAIQDIEKIDELDKKIQELEESQSK